MPGPPRRQPPPDYARRLVTATKRYKKARVDRDEAIVAAVAAGGSERAVAELAGVTQTHVRHLVSGWRSSRH